MDHLRRGLALGSGPDEKVALRLYVSARPQCEATLRQYQTPVRGGFAAGQSAVVIVTMAKKREAPLSDASLIDHENDGVIRGTRWL